MVKITPHHSGSGMHCRPVSLFYLSSNRSTDTQYEAKVTRVKIVDNAKSVLQNLNSFSVVILVLIQQGGHSALTKCLFVEFGTANAKRGTA